MTFRTLRRLELVVICDRFVILLIHLVISSNESGNGMWCCILRWHYTGALSKPFMSIGDVKDRVSTEKLAVLEEGIAWDNHDSNGHDHVEPKDW